MTHLVDRLELEVSTADPTEARRLHDRLSRLHHQTLTAVLERVLDQFSAPGTIQRLESLSLDLGAIPADELERRFPERLERALGEALRSRLRTAQRIETAPARDRPQPTAAAEVGHGAAPLPGWPLSAAAPSTRPQPGPASGESPDTPSPRPAPQSPESRDLELLACFAATGILPWWAPRQDARLIPATVARALRLPLETFAPFLRQLAAGPAAFERLLSASEPDQRLLLLQVLGSRAAAPLPPGPEAPTTRAQAAEPAPHPREPPAEAGLEVAPPASPPPAGEPALRATAGESLLPSPQHQGDTLTVDGAGLALLWPFLGTLFDRLGWLTPERRFVGAAEQQRALALLGYLVDGDPRPPEWRLTLVKLLCGLPLAAVGALEEDLSATELQEADKLLQAVLAHGAGLLGEEVDSLRATWLQRPGLLRWRPQAWLLVVERRDAMDGALQRLPWSLSWLRLPWMEELVQVAW
jgi:hypothetical protein